MPLLENELLQILHNYYRIKHMGMFSSYSTYKEINILLLDNCNFDKQSLRLYQINKIKYERLIS